MKTTTTTLLSLAAALTLSACGPDVGPYLGTWTTTGTSTFRLNAPTGPQTVVEQLNGPMRIDEGIASDVVISTSSCIFPADILGEGLVVQPGHTCTLMDQEGIDMKARVDNGSITLHGSGGTFSVALSFSATGNTKTVNGVWTISSTITRLAK